MPRCLQSISIVVLLWSISLHLLAQDNYPREVGQRVRYELIIEMPKAYLSGILIMVRKTDESIDASIVNEFGVSLLDFSYNEKRQKVKLHNVMKKLNKWYIKRVLRQDLKAILAMMSSGEGNTYRNRYDMNYQFSVFNELEE